MPRKAKSDKSISCAGKKVNKSIDIRPKKRELHKPVYQIGTILVTIYSGRMKIRHSFYKVVGRTKNFVPKVTELGITRTNLTDSQNIVLPNGTAIGLPEVMRWYKHSESYLTSNIAYHIRERNCSTTEIYDPSREYKDEEC